MVRRLTTFFLFVLTAYLIDTPQHLWVKALFAALLKIHNYVAGLPLDCQSCIRSVREARFTPGASSQSIGLLRPCRQSGSVVLSAKVRSSPHTPPLGSPRDYTRGLDCRVRLSFVLCARVRHCGALRDHGHGIMAVRSVLMAAGAAAGATRASEGPGCARRHRLRGAG